MVPTSKQPKGLHHIGGRPGLTPVFCDVDPVSHNIGVEHVLAKITPRTTGIIGVHLWGRPCDVEGLQEVARRKDLKLIFDAAHAFGCSYKDSMIGNFGDVEVFSFHATKFLNTFEGGALTTNDDELARKVRLMRNFGFAGYDSVTEVGTNGKMSEISAAMGLTSLDEMERIVATNYANYSQYQSELASIPGIGLISYPREDKSNYQYVVVEVDGTGASIGRDDLARVLWAENLRARRYFYPGCHNMDAYALDGSSDQDLPHTSWIAGRTLTLPTGTCIQAEDISAVCDLIRFVVANGGEIQRRLRALQSVNVAKSV